MSLVLLFGLVLTVGSGIYLFYLNNQESLSPPANPKPKTVAHASTSPLQFEPQPQSPKTSPSKGPGRGARIGIVFLANIVFFVIQCLVPAFSINIFAFQIGLNLMAAIYCFFTDRDALGKTFLLCLLWVFLIGPAILASLCFVIVGVGSWGN